MVTETTKIEQLGFFSKMFVLGNIILNIKRDTKLVFCSELNGKTLAKKKVGRMFQTKIISSAICLSLSAECQPSAAIITYFSGHVWKSSSEWEKWDVPLPSSPALGLETDWADQNQRTAAAAGCSLWLVPPFIRPPVNWLEPGESRYQGQVFSCKYQVVTPP